MLKAASFWNPERQNLIKQQTRDMKKILLAAGLLTLLGACVKLPVHKSTWKEDKGIKQDVSPRYYDSESQMFYQVRNDADNVYVHLKTANSICMQKILRNGVKISFNNNGKKEAEVYTKYPLANHMINPERPKSGRQISLEEKIRKIKPLVASTKGDLIWSNGNGEQVVFSADKRDIKGELILDKENNLCYLFSISKVELIEAGIKDLNELSMGIQIDGLKIQMQRPQPTQDSPQMSKGSRNGRGGGRSGGGGGQRGGGQKGRQQSANQPNSQAHKVNQSTDLWFKVEFSQK